MGRLGKKRVQEQLEKHGWAVYHVAKVLGVSPEAIYYYLRRYPELQMMKDRYEGETLDFAEISLRQKVVSGDAWAIKYILSTKGKSRGYVERTELTGADEQPIQIIIQREAGESDQDQPISNAV